MTGTSRPARISDNGFGGGVHMAQPSSAQLHAFPNRPQRPIRSKSHQKKIDDLRRVKSARFNAAQRLTKKEAASIEAMAVSGLFGFVLPYFVVVFSGSISPHLARVLEFTGFVSGSLSLVVGLIEQSRDYRMRAAALHACGLKVNKVLRRLETQEFRSDDEMLPLIEEYEQALAECSENHDDIDVELASARYLARRGKDPETQEENKRKISRLTWKAWFEVYRIYLIIWMLPCVIGSFVFFAFD